MYLQAFINQIQLIIRLQPQRYASDFSWIGLVGIILSGPTQAWFVPLVETSSPLLENFTPFIDECVATFGETDRGRTRLTCSILSNKAHVQPLNHVFLFFSLLHICVDLLCTRRKVLTYTYTYFRIYASSHIPQQVVSERPIVQRWRRTKEDIGMKKNPTSKRRGWGH